MFNGWIDKKCNVNEYIFSRTKIVWGKLKVELDLSNYAKKADLKNDASKLAKKVD